jgi:hypothetical protein
MVSSALRPHLSVVDTMSRCAKGVCRSGQEGVDSLLLKGVPRLAQLALNRDCLPGDGVGGDEVDAGVRTALCRLRSSDHSRTSENRCAHCTSVFKNCSMSRSDLSPLSRSSVAEKYSWSRTSAIVLTAPILSDDPAFARRKGEQRSGMPGAPAGP